MKSVLKIMMMIVPFTTVFSCKKDDAPDADSKCYVCTAQAQSLGVCSKEDGDFLVDGNTVANPNKASLEEYIRTIGANPYNDPALEGIGCKKK